MNRREAIRKALGIAAVGAIAPHALTTPDEPPPPRKVAAASKSQRTISISRELYDDSRLLGGFLDDFIARGLMP